LHNLRETTRAWKSSAKCPFSIASNPLFPEQICTAKVITKKYNPYLPVSFSSKQHELKQPKSTEFKIRIFTKIKQLKFHIMHGKYPAMRNPPNGRNETAEEKQILSHRS